MTPELIAAIIAILGALGALIKAYTDNIKIKNERAQTAQKRDQDSLELHDQVQKSQWECKYLKDEIQLLSDKVDDQARQTSILNTELAKLSVKLDNVLEAIKDLKEAK